MYRKNTYHANANVITVDPVRARAFAACLQHYSDVFMHGNTDYSIPSGTIRSADRMRQMAAFFFWTAWASATNRPFANLTYTHNWPHEALIGNRPSGEMVMWTGVSIIMLLAGICALVWWHASERSNEEPPLAPPKADPLGSWKATPSQWATLKYFWVVSALMLVQMRVGVITAHYGVEGNGF
jgi:nitric oxide reductase subunit B